MTPPRRDRYGHAALLRYSSCNSGSRARRRQLRPAPAAGWCSLSAAWPWPDGTLTHHHTRLVFKLIPKGKNAGILRRGKVGNRQTLVLVQVPSLFRLLLPSNCRDSAVVEGGGAPKSVGSMTTRGKSGKMKPTSWQDEFNGIENSQTNDPEHTIVSSILTDPIFRRNHEKRAVL